jgi:uncharacterized protein YndB with AHSA1/START domain
MPGLTVEQRIEAPPHRVFEIFTDLEHAADRIKGIQHLEVLTDGPVGVGTRFRETRKMFGKEATEEMEITAFEPPESYTTEAESHGSHYTAVFRFVPEDDGRATRVRFVFDARPLTLLAKVLGFLTASLAKNSLRKVMTEDLRDLARHAESSAGGGGGEPA